MSKNSQHLHCLVLAYSYGSWLQSTLPSVEFWPSLDTETSHGKRWKKQIVSSTLALRWCNLFLRKQANFTPVCIGATATNKTNYCSLPRGSSLFFQLQVAYLFVLFISTDSMVWNPACCSFLTSFALIPSSLNEVIFRVFNAFGINDWSCFWAVTLHVFNSEYVFN